MKKRVLLCLDMDNTIVYSNKVHIAAFRKSFKKNGLRMVPDEELLNLFGLVARVIIRKLFPELTMRQVLKVVDDHDTFVVNETAKYVRVVRGAKNALKILKKDYPLALLSNMKRKEIVAILKAAGIDRSTFSVLVGNNQVKHPKPAPDAVRLAMRRTGIHEGYMVGDTVYDILAGKGAGLKTVSVLTGHHSRARLKKEGPDYILKSVADLPKILG